VRSRGTEREGARGTKAVSYGEVYMGERGEKKRGFSNASKKREVMGKREGF